MIKELHIQLENVNNEITACKSGNFENEVLVVSSEEFRDGYLHQLELQKVWLENMIANFDD